MRLTSAIDRTPQQFFEAISKNNFNNRLEIQPYRSGYEVDYKVTEVAKQYFFNPIRFLFRPETDKNKLALATNLAAMVKRYAGATVNQKTCDIEAINTNLQKMSQRIIRHSAPAEAKLIQAKFEEAIKLLADAKFNKSLKFFTQDRAGLKTTNAVDPDDFYKQLANTGWFGRFRPFNQRFHIKQPQNGVFEIHTSSKPSFFQKRSLGPVNAAEKAATVRNLSAMILSHKEFIRSKRFDVAGIVQNLEGIKKNITRNTTSEQRVMIEKDLASAISELKKNQMLIAKDKSKDSNRKIARFVRDWVILFPINKAVVPAIKGGFALAAKVKNRIVQFFG